MFRRLPEADRDLISFTINGAPASARPSDSVAAAMLANGFLRVRTSAVSGEPRGPYCMMGVCFECLLSVDGKPNQQACMTRVLPGMRVETQLGKPGVL